MLECDRAYALALADCLDNPVAPDGTFLGLTDSALAAKALRFFAGAAERGPASTIARKARAASRKARGGVSRPFATIIADAETGSAAAF